MIVNRLICLAVGYLLGLFQTGYFYGRAHGIDIRTKGSGNAGTTNTLRVLGTKAGVIVLFGDILKCILAILFARFVFGKAQPELEYLYCMYAALGAILGHNYPFYLQFKGGKGIACTAGLILSLHPYFIPVGVVLFFGIFFSTHMVSLGSLVVYAAFLIQMVVMGELGIFNASRETLIEIYTITVFLTVMAYWRHRANIGRLLRGEEKKVYLTKKSEQ